MPNDGDELVAVAYVRDEVEGEMLRGLLEGEGIPSMVRASGISGRTIAGDVRGLPAVPRSLTELR